MTEELLQKANDLLGRIEVCKNNLKNIRYTQSENSIIRESHLQFNGIEDVITVPKALFRTVGKLIQDEYIKELEDLQKEFDNL